MPWNVISSQWTGLYKLGRYGLAFNQHSSYVMELKNFFIGLQFQLILGGSTSNFIKWLCLVKWLKEVQKGCSVK